jgi:anti-sigma B factor antagonist
MSDALVLSTSRHGTCAVVRAVGEVDLGTASRLSEAATAAIADIGPALVLDIGDVTFMDSTGLKVLLAVQKRAQLAGGMLAIANAARPVQRVIEVTGLDRTLTLCPDVDTAIATCAAPAPPHGTSVSD